MHNELWVLLAVHTCVALGDLTGATACSEYITVAHYNESCYHTQLLPDTLWLRSETRMLWIIAGTYSVYIVHLGFLFFKKHNGLIMEKKDLICFYSHSAAYKYQISMSLECIC